jgi:hypothetical protein
MLAAGRPRSVISHEFGHAALAGSSGARRLGPRIQEGFAEAVGLVHLRAQNLAAEDQVIAGILTNADPTYGGGLRIVLPAVERHGLYRTLTALRENRPGSGRGRRPW